MIRIILLTEHLDDHIELLYKGAKRYSYENSEVEIYKMPILYRYVNGIKGGVQALLRWNTDAVIGRFVSIEDLQEFQANGIKTIALESCKRFNNVPHIIGNHVKLADLCVNYFLERGYVNLAFFGSRNRRWVDEFYLNCVAILNSNGIEEQFYSYRFVIRNYPLIDSNTSITEWVKKLPKPTGVICCSDKEAYYITEICRRCGIKVPCEVAVLGVGNDENLCNLSQPTS